MRVKKTMEGTSLKALTLYIRKERFRLHDCSDVTVLWTKTNPKDSPTIDTITGISECFSCATHGAWRFGGHLILFEVNTSFIEITLSVRT